MTRKELIEYCLTMPLSYEDYPFDDITDLGCMGEQDGLCPTSPGVWTVMRHQANKKSFALIYERNDKLCVNLKCDPFEADFLRQMYTDITPAYHMNKQHWNTVTLDGDVPEDEMLKMIGRSYDLIKPKSRKRVAKADERR